MIEMIVENERAMPKIFCDSCGREISNAKQAAVVFTNFTDNGKTLRVDYVHKNFVHGNCLTKAEELIRLRGEEPAWAELRTHLAYLIHNLGLSFKDIERENEQYY